jgi:hypothetical protein
MDEGALGLDEAAYPAFHEGLGGGGECNPAFHMQWQVATRWSEVTISGSLSEEDPAIDHVTLGGPRRAGATFETCK